MSEKTEDPAQDFRAPAAQFELWVFGPDRGWRAGFVAPHGTAPRDAREMLAAEEVRLRTVDGVISARILAPGEPRPRMHQLWTCERGEWSEAGWGELKELQREAIPNAVRAEKKYVVTCPGEYWPSPRKQDV